MSKLSIPVAIWLLIVVSQYLWIFLTYRRSKKREALFRIITENAADMIALVDTKGRRLYNSPSYERVLGYTPRELAETPVFEQIHPDDRFKVLEASREARATGVGKSLQYRLRHKNGAWRVLESAASTIKNDRGEVEKLVIVNRDVTERVNAEERLAHNPLHDGLTDLPNRRLFLDRLQRCHAQTRRNPTFHYAVMLVDIDGFKALNHTLGSAAGDQLLIETGLLLQSSLREADVVARPLSPSGDALLARFGGDEFVFLLEGCANESDVLRVAERAQVAVAAPLMIQQQQVQCTIGIGSAISSSSRKRADDTLRDAETALRRAQALGAGRSELFDAAMHTRAVHRLKLENDLRTALNRNQFRVVYQPILRIHPRQVVAFEALLRWQHPEQGLIAPNEFLAAAEDTGLMAMIDQWVIREACGQLPAWQVSNGGVPVRAAINLSARHFASAQLIDGIKNCLRDAGVAPSTLQLEISDTIATENPDHTAAILEQLRRLGVTTALDNFGGNSISLPSLHRCSYDVLKINRSLITSMQADRTSQDVVDAILTLARKLNCKVVAEGLEKPAQLEKLRTLGCDLAQGYFFSSAMDPKAALQLLQKLQPLAATPFTPQIIDPR
jgi:diguanylate cyclase (GGDEF)-like protein/PAS domain S-box-containing protein